MQCISGHATRCVVFPLTGKNLVDERIDWVHRANYAVPHRAVLALHAKRANFRKGCGGMVSYTKIDESSTYTPVTIS